MSSTTQVSFNSTQDYLNYLENERKNKYEQFKEKSVAVFKTSNPDEVIQNLYELAGNSREAQDLIRELEPYQKPYIRVYTNLFPIGETDGLPWEKENPWIHSRSIPYHPGKRQALPKELDCFFAYGDCSFEEAKIIFVTDSNHAHKLLFERRYEKSFNFILKDSDTLMLEGLHSDVKWKAEMPSKKIAIKGCEDPNLYSGHGGAFSEVNARNVHIKKCIQSNVRESSRVVVIIGEGHITKNLIRGLTHYIVISDKEIIFQPQKEALETEKNYYEKHDIPDLFSTLKKIGVVLENRFT